MARRSRENRTANLGFDENRPSRDDRRLDHRRTRHATNQMLHGLADPEDIEPLPEVRRSAVHERVEQAPVSGRRFKVWKTKFWKRRDSYRDMRAELDAHWSEVDAPDEEEHW